MKKVLLLSILLLSLIVTNTYSQTRIKEFSGFIEKSSKSNFLFESFEGNTYPPAGWTAENGAKLVSAQTSTLAYPTETTPPYHGSKLVFFNCNTSGTRGETAKLITPEFDASTSGIIFSMVLLKDRIFGSYNDSIKLRISTDGGQNWEHFGGPYLRFGGGENYYWEIIKIPITNGTANTKISIECTSDWGRDVFIDYVRAYVPSEHDLGIIDINPKYSIAGRTIEPEISIENFGENDETEFSITLTDGKNYNSTFTNADYLFEAGEKAVVTMDEWTLSEGNQTLTATISFINDEDETNNTMSVNFIVYSNDYAKKTYTLNATTAKYYELDLTTGTTGFISDSYNDPFPVAEEFDGEYIYRLHSNGLVGIVYPNGIFEEIGIISQLQGAQPTGLAYNWTTEQMFMTVVNNQGNTQLCKLNMQTLALANVGSSHSESNSIIGIDFAADGYIYGPGLDEKLYKIDPQTGVQTSVGNTNINLNYGQDVSYNFKDSRLYTITAGETYQDYKFGYYNLETGDFTTIEDMNSIEQFVTFVITIPKNNVNAETILSENNVNIFPNPSNGEVNIEVSETSFVKLFDISGKTITEYKINANSRINITQPAGVYLLHIESNNQTSVHKIIIN